MKNIPLFDILFIILAAVVLLLVNHFVDAQFISKYAFMFVLTAYYVGKRLGKAEMRMNKDQELWGLIPLLIWMQ